MSRSSSSFARIARLSAIGITKPRHDSITTIASPYCQLENLQQPYHFRPYAAPVICNPAIRKLKGMERMGSPYHCTLMTDYAILKIESLRIIADEEKLFFFISFQYLFHRSSLSLFRFSLPANLFFRIFSINSINNIEW